LTEYTQAAYPYLIKEQNEALTDVKIFTTPPPNYSPRTKNFDSLQIY